jgi:uncharacterized membrane protein
MKKFLGHVRSRVLAGLIFLVPVFAIFVILQKIWIALTRAGNYLVQLFGLKSLLGGQAVTIATACLLVVLFYFFGWLVKIRTLNKMRDWIERSALQHIPGYLTYKAQIQEKINPKQDNRTPVWVTTDSGKRPGLLIDEQAEEAIIFFPNSPDSNNGQVLIVGKERVTRLNMNASSFIKSMQKFGRDLVIATTSQKNSEPAMVEH